MKKKPTKPDKKPTKKEEQLRTKKAKEILIKELIKSFGNVTTACHKSNLNRTTYYDWMENDKKFKQLVDDIPEIRLDFYEEALEKQIKKGNIAGIIFALKSQGKNRGWIERQEISQQIQDNRLTADQFSEAWKEEKGEKNNADTKRAKRSHKKP